MKKIIASFWIALRLAMPAYADISITIDTDFAKQTLETVCSGKPINENEIRASQDIQNMIAHFAQFRDYFTVDAYVSSLRKAALCEQNERDIFRFNDVISNKALLEEEISWIDANSGNYSGEITDMLSPYAPEGINYTGTATIMIGTPSCGGWSKGSAFYVDLPCITNDRKGLQYLIAHESYHGIQDAFMPPVDDAPDIVKLFDQVVREGSATSFADFSKIKDGQYTQLNRDVAQTNKRRMHSNFDLLEMAVTFLKNDTTANGFEAVNNIGFSGSYGSPLYWVGYTMINAIEEEYGAVSLACLIEQGPVSVFYEYGRLAETQTKLPPLGKNTLTATASLYSEIDMDCY